MRRPAFLVVCLALALGTALGILVATNPPSLSGLTPRGPDIENLTNGFADLLSKHGAGGKRVELLTDDKSYEHLEYLAVGVIALDQTNPYEMPQRFLVTYRQAEEIPADHEECTNSGKFTGSISGLGSVLWNARKARLTVDGNYRCFGNRWASDGQGSDVPLRALGPAVVGYATYVIDQLHLKVPFADYDVSCVAGVVLWGLTQPFKLAGSDKLQRAYLNPAQAQVVLKYIASRTEAGNRSKEGFDKHVSTTTGCITNGTGAAQAAPAPS